MPEQRLSPIEEPTIAHPIIAPQSGPHYPVPANGPYVPAQRLGDSPVYPNAPISGQVFAPTQVGGPHAYGERRRGLGIFAAIAAVLAAVIAVAALVFVLASRTSDPGNGPDVPTLAGSPPTDVQLRDDGSTVGVTWKDPTAGTVSFMVIMGRPGLELTPSGTLGPGQTSYELTGLNPGLNYCFAVVAVYSGNQFATSPQACTSRVSATPR